MTIKKTIQALPMIDKQDFDIHDIKIIRFKWYQCQY